jgi:hypothetical protein
MKKITGVVSGVYCCLPNSVRSEQRQSIELTWDGIVDDRHYGRLKPAGGREAAFATRDEQILNARQVSLVCSQELADIARSLNVAAVTPEQVGANVVIEGIPNLTSLPAGTILKFAAGPVLYGLGENLPCIHPGQAIAADYGEGQELATSFPKAAMKRRGIVALVLKPGSIKAGDAVIAITS